MLVSFYIRSSDTSFYISIRSGILWAFFIIGILLLGIFSLFSIVTFLILIFVFLSIELYFYRHSIVWQSLKKLKKK